MNNGEDHIAALQRELQEETGLLIEKEKLTYVDKKYIRYPEFDFTFYIYKTMLPIKTPIIINPKEHKAFIWITPQESQTLPLMEDIYDCIKEYIFPNS